MNFAIDIMRPRTKLAMQALGIEPNELLLKNFDDFAGRNINPEVQQLRFSYYARKLKEVIRQLNSYIREEAMRRLQTMGEANVSPQSLFLTQSYQTEEVFDEIAEIKLKEKNKIIEGLNETNEAITNSIAIEKRLQMGKEARERVQTELVTKRMKLKKFKEKQLENIKRIRKEQEKKEKNYASRDFSQPKRRSPSEQSGNLYSQTFTEFHESDTEIDLKMSQFDEKMQRSQRNYEKNIQQKREAASKLLEKNVANVNNDKSSELDLERICRMIEKQKQVDARRHSFVMEQQEHREELRKKHKRRRSVALERIKEERKLEDIRARAIERRMEVSERILKQKHESWMKELELKNELSKLKDEEALLNAERKRRIM